MKIPLTPAGIEPETLRIVAQHLNHCATAGSRGPPVHTVRVHNNTMTLYGSYMTADMCTLNFFVLKMSYWKAK